MSLGSRFFAFTYDRQIAKTERAGLRERRRNLLADVRGDVLEVGAGTGANLDLYGPDVSSLTLTEPEPPMIRRLERRVATLPVPPVVLRAPAEDLPFDDASFDVVVSTLVLCGVGDQARALREMRRVLRPNGELRFIEHVRSDDARVARKQDRMNGFNRLLVRCECNRPTLTSIEQAGFQVDGVEHFAMPKFPSFLEHCVAGRVMVPMGSAVPPATLPG